MTVAASVDPLASELRALAPIDLAEIERVAALRTRIDRKYVVEPAVLATLLPRVGAASAVLTIDDRQAFSYRSLYFDSDDLVSYRGAALARRNRFKVRTRTYEDDDLCSLEVKTRGARGATVKERLPYDPADHDRLTGPGRDFVADRTGIGRLVPELHPVLTTAYCRSTLVDRLDGSRTTIDRGLVCTDRTGTDRLLDGHVVVETKSSGAATAVDRLLWGCGLRPVRISKFGVGMALHRPWLPANRWNRVLRTHFGWQPSPRAVPISSCGAAPARRPR